MTTARSALSVEVDRRLNEDQPSSWQDVVELGVGVARAVLGEEPKNYPGPWVRGGEAELLVLDREVSRATGRKRSAETAEQWHDANVDVPISTNLLPRTLPILQSISHLCNRWTCLWWSLEIGHQTILSQRQQVPLHVE